MAFVPCVGDAIFNLVSECDEGGTDGGDYVAIVYSWIWYVGTEGFVGWGVSEALVEMVCGVDIGSVCLVLCAVHFGFDWSIAGLFPDL